MAHMNITITPEFKRAVADYQKTRNLPSWTAALLELAAIGYRQETGRDAPQRPRWGGKRRPNP